MIGAAASLAGDNFKCNALGAITRVTAIPMTGYAFAKEFSALLDYFETHRGR